MFAFLAAHTINFSYGRPKRHVTPEMLVRFPDEETIIPEEDREQQAQETFKLHKERFWMLLKHDEKGKIKKFDQKDWDRIMDKLEN